MRQAPNVPFWLGTDLGVPANQQPEIPMVFAGSFQALVVAQVITQLVNLQDVRQKTMREEYDLNKIKVKRRGVLPGLHGEDVKQAKVRITISLDQDVVDYFKHAAEQPGALPYQNFKLSERSQTGCIGSQECEVIHL